MRSASIVVNVGTKSNGDIRRLKVIVPGEVFKVEVVFKIHFEG